MFDAWTKPEHIPNWMLGPRGWTMPVCEIDLRPGGAWRFAWRKADGAEMEHDGVYREVVAARAPRLDRVVGARLARDGQHPRAERGDGVDDVVIDDACYPSKEARDAALGTGMKEGMSLSFDRLDAYLA